MIAYKPHQMPQVTPLTKTQWDGYRQGMPLLHGHYVGLKYVPKQHIANMQSQWKAWAKENPKHTWPAHLTDYIEQLKRDGKNHELLEAI